MDIRTVATVGGGLVAGGLLTVPVNEYLPSPKDKDAHAKHGHDLQSADDALATFGSIPFVLAAGIGLGLSKRSGKAGLDQVVLGSTAMFTGLASSTLAKAENEGLDHLAALGLLSVVGAGGYAAGATKWIPKATAQSVAHGSLGLFGGIAAVGTLDWARDEVQSLRNSVEHRPTRD